LPWTRLIHPQTIHNVGWVIAAGVLGFVGNEVVAVYRIRVGRRIGSAALVADGLHARTDGLTSLGVVAGGIGVLAGFRFADPIVGLAITVAILFVLKSAALEIYRRLMDGVDPDIVDVVRGVLNTMPGVESVDSVRVRWIGHRLSGRGRDRLR
jgi:cation diffusion facilitator family transporter